MTPFPVPQLPPAFLLLPVWQLYYTTSQVVVVVEVWRGLASTNQSLAIATAVRLQIEGQLGSRSSSRNSHTTCYRKKEEEVARRRRRGVVAAADGERRISILNCLDQEGQSQRKALGSATQRKCECDDRETTEESDLERVSYTVRSIHRRVRSSRKEE